MMYIGGVDLQKIIQGWEGFLNYGQQDALKGMLTQEQT
jgi:hypothetical protein